MKRLIIIWCLVIITQASSLFPRNDFSVRPEVLAVKSDLINYRLPNTTIPLEYTIILTVDPNQDTFQGQTTIRIKCISNTNVVVLHADGLYILNTTFKKVSGMKIDVVSTDQTQDDRHFYTIRLGTTLFEDQEYEIIFDYEASFGTGLRGLYKSSYNTTDGVKRYLAVTQFESTFARKAFPCYDEPALKAVFNIHIYAPNDYHSISNMDAITSNMPPIPDYNVTSFRSSPLMSSYLVAFVISDFEYKSNTRDGPKIYPREFRVYAKPSANDTLDFALNYGQRSLMYLQNYTNVEYRLPKIDHVGVPDFEAVAMENWGLVIYDEIELLHGVKNEEAIASIMTHEQSHYWFGNEVSPLWWDYTWLNEGFASFFQEYIADKVTNDKWRLMDKFPLTTMNEAMKYDLFSNAKAMSAPVNSPKEILDFKFKKNSYLKAPSVIRMIHHVLGEAVFQESISAYLKSLPTGVADPQKLFTEMQNVVGNKNILPKCVTIGDIFGSWTDQAGFPVINVARQNPSEIRITQQRYYENSTMVTGERWWIPLTWITDQDPDSTNTTTQYWMNPNDSEITLLIDPSIKWIMFNKERCGYYRVNYDKNMWNEIVNIFNSDEHHIIPPMTKALLIDDAATFSRTGRLDYNVTLDLLSYLSRETNWIPWTPVIDVVLDLNLRMKSSKNYDLFKKFIRSILQNKIEILITKEDSNNSAYILFRIQNILCSFGLKDCWNIDQLISKKSFFDTQRDQYLKKIIDCSDMRLGLPSLWNETFFKYVSTSDEVERRSLIESLSCSQDKSIIDSYLNMTIFNQSGIKFQDIQSILISVIDSGPIGVERVIAFLQTHFIALINRLPKRECFIEIIVKLGDLISNEEQVEMFNVFVLRYARIFTESENVAIDTVKCSISWINYYIPEIEAWLTNNVKIN